MSLDAWPTWPLDLPGFLQISLASSARYGWRSIFPDISLFCSISLDVSQQNSSPQYKSELDYTKQIKTGIQMLW